MIFNRFVHSRMVIDVLTDVWVEEVIKVFVEVFAVNVWTGVVIDSMSDVQVDVKIDVVSDIDVEVLTDVNANVLVVTMTALQFAMPSPCEESISFC